MKSDITTLNGKKILPLSMGVRRLQEIAYGKIKTVSQEILPRTQNRYVILDDEDAITAIIHYDAISFETFGASVLVEVESAKLYEIVDGRGELIYFTHNGKRHQRIVIEYTLGKIINRRGI